MVVFRHTDKIDTTSTSQANGISFDISHYCVDIIVRDTKIHFEFHSVIILLLIFILSFILFLVGLRRHGLWEFLWPEKLRAGPELSPRCDLRHVRHQVLLHLEEANLRRVRQCVLHPVPPLGLIVQVRAIYWGKRENILRSSYLQTKDVCSVRSPQQETSSSRRTDEAQSEGSTAFPHEEANKYQVLRR